MTDPMYDRGLAIRQQMFGAEATAGHIANADDFTRDLQDMVTRFCFGEVWGREELPLKERSMVTVAMLCALGRPDELKVHIRGAISNGVSKVELREIFLQAAAYCGIPAAVGGFRAAYEAFAEIEPNEQMADPSRA